MGSNPLPILGTALWGWTVPKAICFQLLDRFYERGFRQIDTATNYPINKNPEDFRKAEHILREWIMVNGISDLQILIKAGSLNNAGGSENNLKKSFLLLLLDEYEFLFHENLHTFSLHWDNRTDETAIRDTFEILKSAAEQGYKIGLSGIKNPGLYADINKDFNLKFRIQVKHNLIYSDFERYAPLHNAAEFLAYGINAGGIKLNPAAYHERSSLKVRGGKTDEIHPINIPLQKIIKNEEKNTPRPPITNFSQCGLCFAWYKKGIEAILIGTSQLEQLEDTLDFFEILQQYDYSEFYDQLNKLAR